MMQADLAKGGDGHHVVVSPVDRSRSPVYFRPKQDISDLVTTTPSKPVVMASKRDTSLESKLIKTLDELHALELGSIAGHGEEGSNDNDVVDDVDENLDNYSSKGGRRVPDDLRSPGGRLVGRSGYEYSDSDDEGFGGEV